uniref:NADH-ubiquinone oxidoreductase chain 3 n=1 Tax=Arctica islandica TaxID=59239 RepID=T1QR16_ARCIS|nr:NADH dehydrogenase subunit 3 [Arctica islandica]AGC84104.1 NADH dehydrogenase subunit 3 [Arctica islandica]AGW53603.1 NADH dehydrogenase subunit 3 [Arctica islandica]AGW53615.1 NADH dehydrogenase subunit 3 [Arctica islandica]
MNFFLMVFMSADNYIMSGLKYLGAVFFLSLILVIGGVVISQSWRAEWAKLTSFECGFDAMSSSRCPFSLRFFLLALLFLIFDVEVVLLMPYIFSLKVVFLQMPFMTKGMCFLFLLVLLLGLLHEYNEGTLDWVKDK